MIDLVVVVLAVYWAWATLRDLIPWSLPEWAHPALVIGGTVALTYPDWRLAMAGAGGVLLLHLVAGRLLASRPPEPSPMRLPTRLPPLP
jgi:cobalamin biosynthesis protein CobD/CbiB